MVDQQTRQRMQSTQEGDDVPGAQEKETVEEIEMSDTRAEVDISRLLKEPKERGRSHSVTIGDREKWTSPFQKGGKVNRSPSGKREITEEKEHAEMTEEDKREGRMELMSILSYLMEQMKNQAKDVREMREEMKELKLMRQTMQGWKEEMRKKCEIDMALREEMAKEREIIRGEMEELKKMRDEWRTQQESKDEKKNKGWKINSTN